jgi:hypothetical protein
LYLVSFSQSIGCTDPQAQNYNPNATINDGSCTYSITYQLCYQIGVLTPSVPESSGLCWTNGELWTHNDSGNNSEFYRIDTSNASILQKVTVINYPNNDWEEISSDNLYIYIGDFGNNNGNRTDLKVLRIRKDSISSAFNATVNATAIRFVYSDQTNYASSSNTNFDCEAMIPYGNYLYLFSKNRGDFKTRVYKLSKTPGSYTIAPHTSYNVNGEITGASYNSNINEIVLIGYLSSKKNSFLWFLSDFSGDLFFSGNKRRIEIGSSQSMWQTEGVAYTSGKELFISCETSDNPASLYRSIKAFNTQVEVDEVTNERKETTIFPNPTRSSFEIRSSESIVSASILQSDGSVVCEKHFASFEQNTFDCSSLSPGIYFIKIKHGSFHEFKRLVILHDK